MTSTLNWTAHPDRYREAVWFAFGASWAIDLATTIVFFVASHLSEQNPVTVLSYRLFGLVGVVIAAVCYAALALGITHVLPERHGSVFLSSVTVLYASFALYNATLVAQSTPVV